MFCARQQLKTHDSQSVRIAGSIQQTNHPQKKPPTPILEAMPLSLWAASDAIVITLHTIVHYTLYILSVWLAIATLPHATLAPGLTGSRADHGSCAIYALQVPSIINLACHEDSWGLGGVSTTNRNSCSTHLGAWFAWRYISSLCSLLRFAVFGVCILRLTFPIATRACRWTWAFLVTHTRAPPICEESTACHQSSALSLGTAGPQARPHQFRSDGLANVWFL